MTHFLFWTAKIQFLYELYGWFHQSVENKHFNIDINNFVSNIFGYHWAIVDVTKSRLYYILKCEKTYSNMNFIKNKLRNQIHDKNLKSCLKLRTSYTLNIIKLSKEMQADCSYS